MQRNWLDIEALFIFPIVRRFFLDNERSAQKGLFHWNSVVNRYSNATVLVFLWNCIFWSDSRKNVCIFLFGLDFTYQKTTTKVLYAQGWWIIVSAKYFVNFQSKKLFFILTNNLQNLYILLLLLPKILIWISFLYRCI